MKLSDIVNRLNLNILCGEDLLDREVTGAYSGDLLSDVLASASEGDVWMTIQVHPNVVPIALMKGLSAILAVNGKRPDDSTLDKAREENIPVLGTEWDAYQASGRLWELGLKT